MRRIGLLTLLCLSVLLAVATSSSAAARGQRLGTASYDYLAAADPALAADRAGRTTAVVALRRGLALRTARRGGRFSAAKRLPGSDRSGAPRLAVAPNGEAAVAWLRDDNSMPADPESRDDGCCSRVRAAVVRSDGRRSRVRTLSAFGVSGYPPLTTAAGHRAAVGFEDDDGVYVATADTRRIRGFGRAQRLAERGSLLHVWLVGQTPHVLVLTEAGRERYASRQGYRAVELFRRGGRTIRRVRTSRFRADAFEPSVAQAPDGRFLAVFELGERGRHVLLERRRSGRVRVQTLRGTAVGVAVALSAHHAWIASGSKRGVGVRRLGGGPRRTVVLRPGRRQFPTDLALGVDDRGRGALAGYVSGSRSRRLVAVLGRRLRPLRRIEVAPAKKTFGRENGVSVVAQPRGRARVAFARDDVRAILVGP